MQPQPSNATASLPLKVWKLQLLPSLRSLHFSIPQPASLGFTFRRLNTLRALLVVLVRICSGNIALMSGNLPYDTPQGVGHGRMGVRKRTCRIFERTFPADQTGCLDLRCRPLKWASMRYRRSEIVLISIGIHILTFIFDIIQGLFYLTIAFDVK